MLPLSPMMKKSKWGQSVTPVASVNYLKPPSRKLWQKEDAKTDHGNDKRGKCRISEKEKWDTIQSPQFVDFSNLPTTSDSFFGRTTVIVSTPLPNVQNGKLFNLFEEDSIITSLNNFRLSGICHENEPPTATSANFDNGHEQNKEQYVIHEANDKLKYDQRKCHTARKPQTTTVNPFMFHTREKHRQDQKQERIKKLLEEEKKMRVFRANPVPKFLKSRSVPVIDNKNHNNNNINEKTAKIVERVEKQEPIKKNIESIANSISSINRKNCRVIEMEYYIWRKPPFVPYLSKHNLVKSKTPALHTRVRAQDRKRFDAGIKEKEMQREQLKKMDIAAKKKQEEKEIACLRKQMIHKAQPIRKYKLGLPTIQKRPLTDPIEPVLLKRRRITSQQTL
ncbi:uncharacterized protein LOC143151656 [Ptiloglossa arizonensis]|uniref:uncharacterized protein LOC143151656 n=1 Tax=Ptiloglossa arizonensis TaxID=3350558 RepID=UPI003FA0C6FE